MLGEVWKKIPSLPSHIASSEGRLMVVPYFGDLPNGGQRQYGGEPIFGVWAKDAGRFITVYKGKCYKVHRLVCEAFHGIAPFDDAVVMHIDENAANNRPGNLKWGTQKENLNADGFRMYRSTMDMGQVHIAIHDLESV